MNALKQKTLIAGFGVSGQSTARYLLRTGVSFDVADQNVKQASANLQTIAEGNGTVDTKDIGIIEGEWTAELFLNYQCVVVSPGVSTRTDNFQAARDSGVEVIGDVELFARATTKPVIAVTGSNGKSTVVSMAGEILRAAGLNAAVVGNVGLACLDGLNDDAVDVYVLELSSFQLETVFSLKPTASTVLNVSEDHMDRYNSLDDYAEVKRLVYRNSAVAVVNSDDQRTWSREENHQLVTEFSVHDKRASWHLQLADGGPPVMSGPDGATVAASALCVDGSHNQSNALSAMALVSALFSVEETLLPGSSGPDRYGSGLSKIEELNAAFTTGLGQFTGLPHRTQLIRRANGISWFNDSKGTNVGACVSAIEGLTGPVVLIAGGRGKDADFSPLGGAIEQKCRAVVLIGEDAEKMSLAIGDRVPVFMEKTLKDAVDRASAVARSGDSVLLSPACASFDMFANFEARGDAFADEVNRLCA